MINVNRRKLLGQSVRLALTSGLLGYAATPVFANIEKRDSSPRSMLLAALNNLPDGVQLRNVDDVLRVYRQRQFTPMWHKHRRPTFTSQAVIKKLSGAANQGLDPSKYYSQLLQSWSTFAAPSNPYHLELLLTDSLFSFFDDLAHGNLDAPPKSNGWHLPQTRINTRDITDSFFSGEGSFRQTVTALQPDHRRYQGLLDALQEHLRVVERGGWTRVPTGPTLRPGDKHPRVELLRRRLAEGGDLPVVKIVEANNANTVQSDDLFDWAITEGLKAFQERHGLEADSLLGARTVAELNVPAEQRISQIEVNLNRWRWLPRDPGHSHIMVNTAGYDMEVNLSGEVAVNMNVVVGKPKHRTPMFSDTMEYLVVNPSWYVPTSIAREIMPKEAAKPGYLERNNFEIIRRSTNKPVERWRLSDDELRPNAFVRKYRLRQLPGKSNALGDLKFMMPNQYSIYLHDTNAKSLFAKNRRAYSHGCIRVEHPQQLARVILAEDGWTESELTALFDRKETRTVRLKRNLPVHLTYQSSWVDNSGRTHFREDIYDHDAHAVAQQESHKSKHENAQKLALASSGITVATNTY